VLERVAEALLEHEVLDGQQIKQLVAGQPLQVKPAGPTPSAPAREARPTEGERPTGTGLLPPPVAAPKPTS
jgi:hypothetical protein